MCYDLKILEYEHGKKEIVGRRHFPRFKLSMPYALYTSSASFIDTLTAIFEVISKLGNFMFYFLLLVGVF
jgi:hypothetical protein